MDEEEKNKSLSDSEMTGTTDEAVNVLGVQTGVLNNALKLMDGKYGGAFYVRYICDIGRGCGWLQLIIQYPTGMMQTQLLCKNVCKVSGYEEDGLGEVEGISYERSYRGEKKVYKPQITDSMRSGFYDIMRAYERPDMPIPMRVLWKRIVENYAEIPIMELTIKSSLQEVYEALIEQGDAIIQRDVARIGSGYILLTKSEVEEIVTGMGYSLHEVRTEFALRGLWITDKNSGGYQKTRKINNQNRRFYALRTELQGDKVSECKTINNVAYEETIPRTQEKRNVRPTTSAGYKTVVNVLKRDSFGSQKINHINTIDAKAWLIKLQSEDGKSYSSVHTIRGVVRPAFQMAYEADLIRKNPFDFELHNFLIDDSVKRDAVTSKQEKEFLRFVQQDEHFSECYDGMFILFRTGLRIGEFCGLTLKDIDLEKRTINVNHQLQYVGNRGKYIEKTKTEAGTRVLPMSDEVYAAFKRVVQNRKKPKVEEMIDGYTGFLFLDKRGKPMMPYQWEKRFQHVVEKYNRIYRVQLPKITPHVCRHTFCTNAAKRGISVETLKYLMGHTDISVTSNVYTHLKLEDAQREMERLERIEKEMKKCAK